MTKSDWIRACLAEYKKLTGSVDDMNLQRAVGFCLAGIGPLRAAKYLSEDRRTFAQVLEDFKKGK